MIITYAYDVEILPNFFSVTIVDVKDYLNTFKECVDTKGKPIPLVQKYTVETIKNKLHEIQKKSFYITDTDDSQLLEMLSYINNMRANIDEKSMNRRCDLFGYNSSKYDKYMIVAFLMYSGQCNTTKELITKLHNLSRKIISYQDTPDMMKNDYEISTIKGYSLPYKDIDLMSVFALNKASSGIDKDGNKVFFPKSLKQTSINLQWYELLEYELPPISDKDRHFYYKEFSKDITNKELNKFIDKWNRYIIDEWIDATMYYNANDVYIVCEMIRLYIDEIRLRYSIAKSYKVDVLSSSRSNIADKMFIKFYSEFSGLSPKQWRGQKTDRTAFNFKKIIFPFIQFKTPQMQAFLEEMKRVIIYSIGKRGLKDYADKHPECKYIKTSNNGSWFEVTINKLVYTIATGGIHSQDKPRELKSKLYDLSTGGLMKSNDIINTKNIWNNITEDSYVYRHWDISSYYPSIISVYNISPAHLVRSVFVKLVTWLKNTRITAKHAKGDIDGIPHDILAQVLKIVINSIYGKLGYQYGDLYDRQTVLEVTINGQLMIMMLCEELEINDIEVVSVNTDGIVIKLYKKDLDKFNDIANKWKELTKLDADSEDYLLYANSDINNYLVQELNGKISYKGAWNPKMYAVDLTKGYDMPIVAQAVSNYFIYNKPILETLHEATNILDFCKTQNINKKFHIEYTIKNKIEHTQNKVRFYVSNNGGYLEKVSENDNSRNSLCKGYKVTILNSLDDKDIALRNINYTYYYKEILKIIDPIKLGIDPNKKGNIKFKIKSGKKAITELSGMYNTLFDDLNDDDK